MSKILVEANTRHTQESRQEAGATEVASGCTVVGKIGKCTMCIHTPSGKRRRRKGRWLRRGIMSIPTRAGAYTHRYTRTSIYAYTHTHAHVCAHIHTHTYNSYTCTYSSTGTSSWALCPKSGQLFVLLLSTLRLGTCGSAIN
jgi:hypothetical protein